MPATGCALPTVEKRPKGHVLVEGETAVDKVKRDADLLAAEDEEEEDDAEIGARRTTGLELRTMSPRPVSVLVPAVELVTHAVRLWARPAIRGSSVSAAAACHWSLLSTVCVAHRWQPPPERRTPGT